MWMKEGKIQLVRRRMVIISLGWLKPCRPVANKTLLTTEMLEFSGIGHPETLTKISVQPKIDLHSVGEKVA